MQSRHIKCVKFYECLIILNCNPYDIHKVNFLPSILIYDCRVLIRLATGHSRIKFHLKLTRAFSILIHSLGWLVWQIRMFLPMIKGAIQTHSLHRWWWSLSQRRSRKESKVRSSVAFLDLQKTLRGYRRQGERERVWVRKQCLQSWKRKDFELRKSALADDHKQSLFLSLCISLYLYISTSLYLSHSHSIYSTLPLFNSIFLSLPNSLSQSISLSHFYTLAHSLSLHLLFFTMLLSVVTRMSLKPSPVYFFVRDQANIPVNFRRAKILHKHNAGRNGCAKREGFAKETNAEMKQTWLRIKQ